ncbi:MAG: class I SAM-dependent methyltransferase [Thermofilaceae archaeon]
MPRLIIRKFSTPISNFISSLLGQQIDFYEYFNEKSIPILRKIFFDSISPPSGEMPLSLDEALSLYILIKAIKPKVVVETGVSAGRSSGFILQALHENGEGYLYSIDPDPNVGWAIPNYLRYRHKLFIGTSKDILPKLVQELQMIDIFLHDSLHTYDNMIFEYKTVWPALKKAVYFYQMMLTGIRPSRNPPGKLVVGLYI